MKTTPARFLAAIIAIALALMLVLVITQPAAHAQAVPALSSQPSAISAVPAPVPFYASGEFWSGLFGVVAGIVAIWRNQAASTSRKVSETLVLAIEEATKLPGVAESEQRIKTLIREKATDLGVQPLLHRMVKNLTEPAPSAGADEPGLQP